MNAAARGTNNKRLPLKRPCQQSNFSISSVLQTEDKSSLRGDLPRNHFLFILLDEARYFLGSERFPDNNATIAKQGRLISVLGHPGFFVYFSQPRPHHRSHKLQHPPIALPSPLAPTSTLSPIHHSSLLHRLDSPSFASCILASPIAAS